MKDKNHIEKLVEETLNSMDKSERASPHLYLLSRVNARLLKKNEATFWDHLSSFITRPIVTFAGLVLIIMLNVFIISFNNDVETYNVSRPELMGDPQGFSIANSTEIYDLENIEP